MREKPKIPCQHVVVDGSSKQVKIRRACPHRGSYSVVVFLNPSAYILSMENFNRESVNREYIFCGIHRNAMMRKYKNKEGDMWWATATLLF